MAEDDAPERHHFKIGEVAELLGVRPHVLRYWEQEFPALRPKKTRGSHRHYSRENVELARRIRELVVDQGYSLSGAKRRLTEMRKLGAAPPSSAEPVATPTLRADLLAVRAELVALLDFLDGEEPVHEESALDSSGDAEVAVPAAVRSTSSRSRT